MATQPTIVDRVCFLGLDIGASGCKAIIFGDDGSICGRAQQEYSRNAPKPGWVELDTKQWWNTVASTTRQAITNSRVSPKQIRSLGICAETDGIVPVGEDGEPLRQYISWSDARCYAQHEWIQKNVDIEEVYRITGIPLNMGFWSPSALKIAWIRENEPEIFGRTEKFLQIGNYIVYRLTGRFTTDCSAASHTLLFDIEKLEWSKEIAETLGISLSTQPEVLNSSSAAGKVTEEAAKETGLEPGTMVVTGGGDSECGALGAGVISEGQALVSIGTSLIVATTANRPIFLPKGSNTKLFGSSGMMCACHVVPKMWIAQVVGLGGAILSWFNREFCQVEQRAAETLGVSPFEILNLEIEKSEITRDSPIFAIPLGALFNIKLEQKRSDIARSILEGVAYEAKEAIDVAEESKVRIDNVTMIGGGARSAVWRQIMADVTGKCVSSPQITEMAALGAALLAADGVGLSELREKVALKKCIDSKPRHNAQEVYAELFAKYKQLQRSLEPKP